MLYEGPFTHFTETTYYILLSFYKLFEISSYFYLPACTISTVLYLRKMKETLNTRLKSGIADNKKKKGE